MTLRMMLALLLIIPAAMTCPWHQVTHRWILGVAVAVVALLFARWRGAFLTTLIGRRWAVWRRNHGKAQPVSAQRVAVALRVTPGAVDTLPLARLADYLDRYGIRCASVRLVSRDGADGHDTWIGVIVDAEANLIALQARSADLPVVETAAVVARRLAEFLGELGLRAVVDQDPAAPLGADVREGWRSVCDDRGDLTAYALRAGADIQDRVAASTAGSECWTVIEFSGSPAHPVVAVACAVRGGAEVAGSVAQLGRQRPLLEAMDAGAPRVLGLETGEVPAEWTWSVHAAAELSQSNMN